MACRTVKRCGWELREQALPPDIEKVGIKAVWEGMISRFATPCLPLLAYSVFSQFLG